MIFRPGDPAHIPAVGKQLTRPWASPQDIADERMAAHLHPYLNRLGDASGLVCRVWRGDDPDWSGESRADDWPGVRDGERMDRWAASRRRRVA